MTNAGTGRPLRSLHPLRIELVSMPFGALERPALGLGLLQAAARRDGHDCSSRYFGFTFAECVGLGDYQWMANDVPYTAFAGDWLFAEDLYGPDPAGDAEYIHQVLRTTWQRTEADVNRLLRMRSWVEPFLERCLAAVPWADVDLVGFTSTFQQNVASLALARRLAERFPHLTISFGGANWEAAMGVELHRQFPFVDLAFSGEADRSFPMVLAQIAADDVSSGVVGGPGVVHRGADGATVDGGPAERIDDLDSLPMPDFSDFASAFTASPVTQDLFPVTLLETSRGCWWGAHSHCTFCGLNGGSLAYRSKSPDRAFDELKASIDLFGSTRVGFVDNILDMRYFRTFLPRVAEELPGLDMFYEVKSSLTNRQIEVLKSAGVSEIQPGIESLSDHILDLMRKGTTQLRNVQLLKWCREHGVQPDWNVLYGFPGETPGDYAEMLTVIAAIRHLQPPTACGPIRLDRFSPYHDDPAAFGITDVRAMAPYRWLYPVDAEALDRIAYYFDCSLPADDATAGVTAAVRAAIDSWTTTARGFLEQIVSDDDHVVVVDTRDGVFVRHEFTGWQAAVYLLCDQVRTFADLVPVLAGATAAELVAFLDRCVAAKLMLVHARSCLSLAVRTPARRNDAGDRPRYGRRLALIGAGVCTSGAAAG